MLIQFHSTRPPTGLEGRELEEYMAEMEYRQTLAKRQGRLFKHAALVLAVLIGAANWFVWTSLPEEALLVSIVTTSSYTVFFGLLWLGNSLKIENFSINLERALVQKRITSEFAKAPEQLGKSPASYFDNLVKINVENLAEYYSLVKVHTNNSFRASLGAALVGFAFIMIGVVASFVGREAQVSATLAAGAGVVIEFISGVFFYLYNRTVRQLKGYHDSLLAVQNILLALKLVADTDEPAAKREMVRQMCEALIVGIVKPIPSTPTPSGTE